jgi:hypothetical protein
MQEVSPGDVENVDSDQSQQLALFAEDEAVLTPAAANVLARLVRAYLDAKRDAA